MTKFRHDLTLYQGDDWAAMVTVSNPDGTVPDLTGYTAQAQIREGIADQAWYVEAKLLCAVVPPNQISISLTSRQTTRLKQPSYRWDLQLISPDGIITTIMAGEVKMLFEVTRPYEHVVTRLYDEHERDWMREADEARFWRGDGRYLEPVEEER